MQPGREAISLPPVRFVSLQPVDFFQQAFSMAERQAEFPQIGIRKVEKDVRIDIVFCQHRRILRQTNFLQPVFDSQRHDMKHA